MRRSRITCLSALFLVVAVALPALAQVAPIGAPFEIAPAEGSHTSPPLLATRPDGTYLIVWTTQLPTGEVMYARLLGPSGTPLAPQLLLAAGPISDPSVAVSPDGGFVVAWERDGEILVTSYDRDGRLRIPTFPAAPKDSVLVQTEPGVAVGADGGWMVAWREAKLPPADFDVWIVGRRFGPDGTPVSDPLRLSEPTYDGLNDPEVAALPGGGFVAVWTHEWLSVTIPIGEATNFVTRSIDAEGALGLQSAKPLLEQPFLASASPGQFLMVWEEQGRWMGEVHVVGCGEPHLGLCLAQNRFRVEVSWRDHQGNTGTGHAVPLKDDTGSFWFFTPSNVELLVKVLDGRSINHHFWVFYGSLSDVEFDVRVTDTQTGDSQLYHNPAGTLASHADVQAFPPDPGTDPPSASIAAAALPGRVRSTVAPLSPPAFCHSSEEALCLDPLYRVTIDFADPVTGDIKQARAVPFSQESGAFWFFDPNNLELFVKVLDGSAVNGHTWVFYGALTDVEYTLRVRDLLGAEWTYHNRRGQMSSGADTSALPPPARF